MKNLALAILLGLACGWGVSRFFRKPPEPDSSADSVTRFPISAMAGDTPERRWPPAPVAGDPLQLDALRAAAREGRPFSPYRDELFSMDLVRSLDGDALAEAFLAGQIRDELEIGGMFAKLGASDPERALELLWEIPDRNRRNRAQQAMIDVWVKGDPAQALARTAALPDTEFRQLLASDLAHAWIRHDPSAALARSEELARLSGPFGDGLPGKLLMSWAKNDYAAAEAWVLAQAETPRRAAMLDALLVGHLATLAGNEAVAFALDRPENAALQRHLTEGFQNWAMGDPGAAVARFVTLPPGHAMWGESEQIGRAAAMHLLQLAGKGEAAPVLGWSERIPEGEARRQFLLGAANTFSSNDIPAARQVIEWIPESPQRENAIGMFAELWMRKDPVALSEWLGALDPSPSRDRGVERFASLLAASDPERARQWAETIGDEEERGRVIERLAKENATD